MNGKLKISASGTNAARPPPALAAEAARAPSLTIRLASSSLPSWAFSKMSTRTAPSVSSSRTRLNVSKPTWNG